MMAPRLTLQGLKMDLSGLEEVFEPLALLFCIFHLVHLLFLHHLMLTYNPLLIPAKDHQDERNTSGALRP